MNNVKRPGLVDPTKALSALKQEATEVRKTIEQRLVPATDASTSNLISSMENVSGMVARYASKVAALRDPSRGGEAAAAPSAPR
jgi:hypothetical protein